jgi:hypothetical protein
MISKEDIKVPVNELLADLEKHVKKMIGYDIIFIEKVMNEDIKIPNDYIYLTSEPETKKK